jgi:hypothetical protein
VVSDEIEEILVHADAVDSEVSDEGGCGGGRAWMAAAARPMLEASGGGRAWLQQQHGKAVAGCGGSGGGTADVGRQRRRTGVAAAAAGQDHRRWRAAAARPMLEASGGIGEEG